MNPYRPSAALPTHEVFNMPPHLSDQDLWGDDVALREAVEREGAAWAEDRLARFGQVTGAVDFFEKAELANRHTPELRLFDRYGMRIDQVDYHPAYHDPMRTAIEHEVPSFAWNHPGPGAHVGHTALTYMISQIEGGVMCAMAMTYSAIPSLELTSSVANEWLPRLRSTTYDPRDIPVAGKQGATMGMFMTEKQGGSDVRANSTRAVPLEGATGPGALYLLTGHKFFCSAPMCDAFLSLAYTESGLSCFVVPRWRADGQRNGLFIQRLKDKLGNRSNASSEIEFVDAHGVMLGDEGRGVRTIIEMVVLNRFYCTTSSAGLMRQALVQALHFPSHRSAFQRRLVQQPLMRNVLADLAIESEAAMTLALRIGRAIDESAADPRARALARIGTALGKYWVCKRAPGHVHEALECLGGSGYIEESFLPRLYREAPLNSIWEGSGNVICLDVLRAMARDPDSVQALMDELEVAAGKNPWLDEAIERLRAELANQSELELRARRLTELMAVTWQAALLVRHSVSAVAETFCRSRLPGGAMRAFGTLPDASAFDDIIDRIVVRGA